MMTKMKFVCIAHRNVNGEYLDKHLPSCTLLVVLKNVSVFWKYGFGFVRHTISLLENALMVCRLFLFSVGRPRHHKFLALTQPHAGTQTWHNHVMFCAKFLNRFARQHFAWFIHSIRNLRKSFVAHFCTENLIIAKFYCLFFTNFIFSSLYSRYAIRFYPYETIRS